MDTCFTYLDNFPSVQPAPNGKTTLYAARVLEATNAMLVQLPAAAAHGQIDRFALR